MYSDPTGEFACAGACIVAIGAAIGAAIEIFSELSSNGGNLECVSWGNVAVSAGLGAIGGGLTSGLIKGAFRFRVARSIGGRPPSYSWSATKQWGARNNIGALRVNSGQQRHHWLFQQNQGWGQHVPNWIKNQPWNINPVSAPFNNWMAHGATNWRSLLGAPAWAVGVFGGGLTSIGGKIANSFGDSDCECS